MDSIQLRINIKPPSVNNSPIYDNNVFLLRHEERGDNVSFSTPLTQRGLFRSETVVCTRLAQLNIKKIYCSPFLRTLQTIRPFCEKTGIKVNLEWSLVESLPVNPKISSRLSHIVNNDYKPFLPYETPKNTDILDFNKLKGTVKLFVESLDRSENILLVTHMPVINAILSYKGIISTEMYTHHEPGALLSITGDKF